MFLSSPESCSLKRCLNHISRGVSRGRRKKCTQFNTVTSRSNIFVVLKLCLIYNVQVLTVSSEQKLYQSLIETRVATYNFGKFESKLTHLTLSFLPPLGTFFQMMEEDFFGELPSCYGDDIHFFLFLVASPPLKKSWVHSYIKARYY